MNFMPAVEFQAGPLTIAIMEPTAFGQEFRPHGLPIALQVDDVAGRPRGAGGQGREVRHGPDRQRRLPQAIFLDPAGNSLDLHHRYAPADWSPGLLKGRRPHGRFGHQKIRLVWQGTFQLRMSSALRSPSLSDLTDHSARVQPRPPGVRRAAREDGRRGSAPPVLAGSLRRGPSCRSPTRRAPRWRSRGRARWRWGYRVDGQPVIRRAERDLLVEHELDHADVIFVFGGMLVGWAMTTVCRP